MKSLSFYKQTATITRAHLGATAERFITRLIREHTKKSPEAVQPRELQELLDWIELAMRTIYSDRQTVDSYLADLQALISSHTKKILYDGKKI